MEYECPHEYRGKIRKNGRKRVSGIGINDVDLPTKVITSEGKRIHCPIYETWKGVLDRSQEPLWNKNEHYRGTKVCNEWLKFSNFRRWMISQNWYGKQIDKDILNPYSLEYCPENCRFVPREVNCLLTDRSRDRGDLPLGVTRSGDGRYTAQCSINGKVSKKLGKYASPEEAHKVYQLAKAGEIIRVASVFYDSNDIDGDVYVALVLRSNKMYDEYEFGKISISISHY